MGRSPVPGPSERPFATLPPRVAVLAAPLALLACSAARGSPSERPEAAARPPESQPEVRVTRAVAIACPRRDHDGPMALADVDGDGHLDRVAVTRDDAGFTVHLHQAPSLRETRTFHVDGDRVEIAVTRRATGPLGDLWIVALHDRPAEQVLFHLDKGRLEAIWRASGPRSTPSLRLDLDGDGVHEILLRESDLRAVEAVTGAEGTSRWLLLRGDGHVLWRDLRCTVTTAGGRFVDSRARARALALLGDGTLALQLRSPEAEWYVLPTGSHLPDPLPPCLE